jgi:hypothetical protein
MGPNHRPNASVGARPGLCSAMSMSLWTIRVPQRADCRRAAPCDGHEASPAGTASCSWRISGLSGGAVRVLLRCWQGGRDRERTLRRPAGPAAALRRGRSSVGRPFQLVPSWRSGARQAGSGLGLVAQPLLLGPTVSAGLQGVQPFAAVGVAAAPVDLSGPRAGHKFALGAMPGGWPLALGAGVSLPGLRSGRRTPRMW